MKKKTQFELMAFPLPLWPPPGLLPRLAKTLIQVQEMPPGATPLYFDHVYGKQAQPPPKRRS